MTATVTALPRAAKARKPARTPGIRAQSRALARRYEWQRGFAYLLGAVYVVGLILSLSDQAMGASEILHCSPFKGWLLAIVIDVGYVGTEFGGIFAATDHIRKEFMKVGRFIIVGNVLASQAMNSVAFSAHANTTVGMCVAIAAGCALPLFLFAIAKAFAVLYIRSAR